MPKPRRFSFAERFLPVALLWTAFLAVSLATRIVLLIRNDTVLPAGISVLPNIFGRGLYFDAVTGLWFSAPFLIWLALAPNRLAATCTHRAAIVIMFACAIYALTLIGIAEWLFWEEFGARFNFIAVDYLLYTQEVIGNIRESYPVGKILAALALPALAIAGLLARPIAHAAAAPRHLLRGLAAVTVHAALLWGSFSWVDSDHKDFSGSDAANELAGNGIYEFFAANYRNELSFERYYATLPPASALAIAKQATDANAGWLDKPADGFERLVHVGPVARQLNVILISIESMGADFLGAYGDQRGLTPNLDRLAGESIWFSDVYATGNRTVRGLEALALALPPTPGQSIVRRPRNEKLFSLGSVLEDLGYETLFAYGGFGYFDNMNAFFSRNDYRVFDRTDIPKERVAFSNVWGVADETLFDEVLRIVDDLHTQRAARPFFVHVMTTSNHRPYTYPAGRVDIPSGSGREGAVKYTDWCIGHLLAEARKRAWFENTLFVITADHGANARGTVEIPVDKYRIPLFFYSPAHLKPRRIDRLMSQIDVAPTLLGLVGRDYYSKFFGRDMLHSDAAGDRAFVANYQTLGYLRRGESVMLQPQRKVSVSQTDAAGRAIGPARDAELVREAIALYQVAGEVFKSGRYRDEEQRAPERRLPGVPVRDLADPD